MPIEGLQALVDKLEKITDEKMVTKMQKEAKRLLGYDAKGQRCK